MKKEGTIYDGKKILCPISGGINSAAVLLYLYEIGAKPIELHLYYRHFKEHSPDTQQFVDRLFEFARLKFDTRVLTKQVDNSVLDFFKEQKMIPHPMVSPCSRMLKIVPMAEYAAQNGIEMDLVGYIRQEAKRRIGKQKNELFTTKDFPIRMFDEEWCFEIVKKYIGWYPDIYDIKDESGKRVFKHNNCLPCKNMSIKDLQAVQEHYPVYMNEANKLSVDLKAYWGRNAQDYYTTFGKEDYEGNKCEVCEFD